MPLILPNTIANGQNADGEKLQQNFAALQQHLNTEMINRDGSTAMVQPLLLPGPPTQPNQAATKGYVDSTGLIGEVKMWPGASEPAGYMFCRGQAISRATYAALWAVLQSAGYGTGDGSTTFNLPDYRARSPIGVNDGGFYSGGPGERGGSGNSTLVYHTHTGADHLHGVNINTGNQSANHAHTQAGIRYMAYSGPGSEFEIRVGDGIMIPMNTYQGISTGANDTSHIHNVSGTTGGADRSLNTGPNGEGESGYSNYHPIQTINFIIKVT